jgi:hypothetical protein
MNLIEVQMKRFAVRNEGDLERIIYDMECWCNKNLLGTVLMGKSNGRKKPYVVDTKEFQFNDSICYDKYPVLFFDDKDEAELFKREWRARQ